MTNEEFKHLNTGDVVGSKMSGVSYVVMNNYGDRVTAVRSLDMTNPNEFDLLSKAQQYPINALPTSQSRQSG